MTTRLERQVQLQREADELVDTLGLTPMLSSIGEPVRVGSSALGLMVRRDIDITVVCARLGPETLEEFAHIGALLMQKSDRVVKVSFRNDAGLWNREPDRYPDGYYINLAVEARDGAHWTVDIWAVDDPARQPDLAHLKTLPPALTDETRDAILAIKFTLNHRAAAAPPSAHVYEAVIAHGVRTTEQFDAWYASRVSPDRP